MIKGTDEWAIVSDETLMERVCASDAEAFAELYDRHGALAFRVARSICRDTGSAEDAVQEGFLDVWRHRGSYQAGRGSFRPWAISVVRNRAIDSLRRDAVRFRVGFAEDREAPVDMQGDGPEQDLVAGDDREKMRQIIAVLPDAQCEVITLAYYAEMSQAEIAAHLGIPVGTVKGRMRLGLEKLRRQLVREVVTAPRR